MIIRSRLKNTNFNKDFNIDIIYFAGFEEAEKACCSTGTFEMSYLCSDKNPFTCKDANKYVFWDAFHPTEKTNRIASNYLIPKLFAAFR
jgi:phospholipase/lecithinase/hemolysin